jgi:predicted aconitase with swiveling domain
VVPGVAKGAVLTTSQPISFWGGVDPASGLINDPRHELFNQSIAGKVLVFPFGKGSSTSSLIILELARVDKAPAAIVNVRTEPILATGPIVCKHFYDKEIPIICLDEKSSTIDPDDKFVLSIDLIVPVMGGFYAIVLWVEWVLNDI